MGWHRISPSSISFPPQQDWTKQQARVLSGLCRLTGAGTQAGASSQQQQRGYMTELSAVEIGDWGVLKAET